MLKVFSTTPCLWPKNLINFQWTANRIIESGDMCKQLAQPISLFIFFSILLGIIALMILDDDQFKQLTPGITYEIL